MKRAKFEIAEEVKTKHGIYRVIRNTKTGEHVWTTVSRNGYVTTGNRPVKVHENCTKGAKAALKVLQACFG